MRLLIRSKLFLLQAVLFKFGDFLFANLMQRSMLMQIICENKTKIPTVLVFLKLLLKKCKKTN